MLKTTIPHVLILLVLFHSPSLIAKQNPDEVIRKVQKNNEIANETAEIKLVIKERDGSKKTRDVVIKKKNGKKNMALVKIESPANLKGVGLLSVVEGDDETQRLYLPSEKRSRRIVSDNKNGRFLDSDLSYEDLSIKTYKHFKNSIESEKKSGVIIKSIAKNSKDTGYGVIRTWVELPEYRILKSAYYDHKKKLKKVMRFKGYKMYGSSWRASKIIVATIGKNKKPMRSTQLILKKLSLKELNEGEFSISALEK